MGLNGCEFLKSFDQAPAPAGPGPIAAAPVEPRAILDRPRGEDMAAAADLFERAPPGATRRIAMVSGGTPVLRVEERTYISATGELCRPVVVMGARAQTTTVACRHGERRWWILRPL